MDYVTKTDILHQEQISKYFVAIGILYIYFNLGLECALSLNLRTLNDNPY